METEKYSLLSAFQAAINRGHPDVYLTPDNPNNSQHPYFLCESSGNVLFVSFDIGFWVEISGIPKQHVSGLQPLNEENAFLYSTKI